MSNWRRYDTTLFPIFHERFEERWGEGTAPFLNPSVFDEDQPRPRAQWINVDTGACFGGQLTCAVLAPDAKPRFLRA